MSIVEFLSKAFSVIGNVLANAWDVYLLLAPLFLLGLSIAGVLYVLISQATIIRMMGQEGIKSVVTAAAFGLPLPVCSCGVIPITASLRKKGASRPACMSFLITTPETGMDSFLVTWGLMGPIMAIVRPIGAFLSALLAGVCSIAMLRDPSPRHEETKDDHHHHDHHHDHDHSHKMGEDPAVIGWRGLRRSFRAFMIKTWYRVIKWTRMGEWNRPMLHPQKPLKSPEIPETVPLKLVGKRIFTFAFIEMADDILFALVVGVLLSGLVMVIVPDNLAEYGLSGWYMYAIMLLAGIPLYMCASASTPIAAALVAKGISPGAALVFLMTGPATNTTTIVILLQQFGARFVSIYVGSIVVGAVAVGVMLDAMLILTGWEIALNLDGTDSGLVGFLEWTGAILLLALATWRFWKGAATAGYHDMMGNIRSFMVGIGGLAKGSQFHQLFSLRSRFVLIGVPLAAIIYLGSGFTAVPPGYLGYGKLFGQVRWSALEPGLHYAPPWPIGEIDVLPHTIVQRIVVGISDPLVLGDQIYGEASTKSGSNQWHPSSAPASNKSPVAEYLTGDEGLMQILVAVHFQIVNPFVFYYRNAHSLEILVHFVQATVREYIAANSLDDLISRNRREIEHYVTDDLSHHLNYTVFSAHDDSYELEHDKKFRKRIEDAESGIVDETFSIGISVLSTNVVDIHPVPETIAAFREVTNAAQDKETSIMEAERAFTLHVPRALGNAAIELKRSEALAKGRTLRAEAESKAFAAKAEAVKIAKSVLQDLMWYETVERAYNGRQKFILPNNEEPQNLTLWQRTDAKAMKLKHREENSEH